MSKLSPDLAPLELRDAETSEPVTITPKRLVVAGYTGRDDEQVRAHIRELEAMGIAPPLSVPMFYELPVELLTSAGSVTVRSAETSGEVEAVLLCGRDRWWVGIGSDHTARDVERESVPDSKAACPKVVSRDVLSIETLRHHWDDVRVRTWATKDGQELLYQDGMLGHLLPIPAVLGELVALRPSDLDGLVVFLGTVPLLTDGFVYADRYTMELQTPGARTRLTMTYDVRMEEQA